MLKHFPILVVIFAFTACSFQTERGIPQLRVQLKEFPSSFNPLNANDFDGIIFQLLTESDSSGKISSNLLEQFEQSITNDTINAIRFELKQGITWHDGLEVTRDDVLFSLKLSKWVQIQASNTSSFNLAPIKRFIPDAVNRRAFTLEMEGNPEFNRAISGDYLIMPEHVFDSLHLLRKYDLEYVSGLTEEICPQELIAYANSFNQIPPFDTVFFKGSGPYEIESFVPGQSITLTYRQNWWKKVPREITLPQRVNYVVVTDAKAARFALQNKELDLITQVPAAEFGQLESFNETARSLNLYSQAGFRLVFLGFNTRLGKFSNKNTRLALAHLLDIQTIIDVVRFGYAQRTVGPVHPVLSDLYSSDLPVVTQDTDRAKRLLSEAGWSFIDNSWVNSDGEKFGFDLMYNASNQDYEKIAQIVKSEAEKVGIKVTLVADESSSVNSKLRSHQFEATLWSFVGSPRAFNFSPLFHTDAAQPGRLNFTGFGNETTDAIIENSIAAQSREEMAAYLRQLQSTLHSECPMVFLYFEQSLIGASKDFPRLNISYNRPGYDVVGVF